MSAIQVTNYFGLDARFPSSWCNRLISSTIDTVHLLDVEC